MAVGRLSHAGLGTRTGLVAFGVDAEEFYRLLTERLGRYR
jgi:hypothetical protein